MEKKSVVDKVTDYIIQGLIDGKFQPGDQLPTEPELCETLEVGRNSVREAIKKMQAYGLVYIQRPDELILDLSRVSFMDSSGLGLILGRYTKAVELGILFKVQNPTPQIRRILDLAGTERLIKIESLSSAQRAAN